MGDGASPLGEAGGRSPKRSRRLWLEEGARFRASRRPGPARPHSAERPAARPGSGLRALPRCTAFPGGKGCSGEQASAAACHPPIKVLLSLIEGPCERVMSLTSAWTQLQGWRKSDRKGKRDTKGLSQPLRTFCLH